MYGATFAEATYGLEKGYDKMQGKAQLVSPASTFMFAGSLFLALLAVTPIWNAASLLNDFNYIFWAGDRTPTWIIIVSTSIVILYAVTSGIFFRRVHSSQAEQTIMTMASLFITLFGLFLMLVSMPLTQQAVLTSTNLLYNCDSSMQTHRLYEYSHVLQNIRAGAACAKKFSVEECDGYQSSPPFTDFLKNMENNFRCAGFCHKASVAKDASASKAKLAKNKDHVTPSFAEERNLEAADSEFVIATHHDASAKYPPTLFSDSNFQASCDGMASRDIKNFAGDIGRQTFFQGIYLVLIAVATGFLKLLGVCFRKD